MFPTHSHPEEDSQTGKEDFLVLLWSATGMGPGPQAEKGLEILMGRLSFHLPLISPMKASGEIGRDMKSRPGDLYPHVVADESTV